MQNDKTKAVEVFRGTMMEAGIVKSLLENAEVEAFLKDEFLTPWNDASGWQIPLRGSKRKSPSRLILSRHGDAAASKTQE